MPLGVMVRGSYFNHGTIATGRTIDHHVSAILRKLGAHTRGEAVATATTRGYLAS
jgi:DNA-binding response OmpR family regulator